MEHKDEYTERRTDTLSLSKQTATVIAAVTLSFVSGVAVVFWNLVLDSVRHDDRITHLEQFADIGTRFTMDHGAALREEFRTAHEGHSIRLTQLEVWQLEHESWGKQKTGEWEALHREFTRRLDYCTKRVEKHEDNVNGH